MDEASAIARHAHNVELVNEIIVAAGDCPRLLARTICKNCDAIEKWLKNGSVPSILRGRLLEEIRKRGTKISDEARQYLMSYRRGMPRNGP